MKAELAKISNAYKDTVVLACGTHRLHTAMLAQFGRGYGYPHHPSDGFQAAPTAGRCHGRG